MKKWILVLLYAVDVFFCLRAIKKKSSHEYVLTKPFLMPLLCSIYFVFLPSALRNVTYQKYVFLALVFHTLGDVFCCFQETKQESFFMLEWGLFLLGM